MPMVPDDGLEPLDGPTLNPEDNLLQRAWLARGRKALGIVTRFLLGQGAAQGINLVAGLFLVRHLSVQAYAAFGLAIGFQAIFSTLMDFGFAGTIVPMVGDQKEDRALVGRYVRAAKHLRDRSFWLLAPVAAIAFLGVMHRQHWSWGLQLALLLSTLLALYSGGKASYFSVPLFLHGDLRSYYVLQVAAGAVRLGSYLVLAFVGGLNAWVAAAIGALTISFTAEWYARQSKPLMLWPERDDPETDKKVFQYIIPAAPAVIFAAFQAQITLLLISLFGGRTLYIAQVAALGRIGQVFAVLTTFNLIVIEPFVARLNQRRLVPAFLGFPALACLVLLPVSYAAFTWPQVFLYLIGPKYENLRDLLGWVILAACINYVGGLVWMMNRARKWVFWSGSFLEIALLLGAQIAFVALVGMRNTRDAVFLSLVASVCPLTAHVCVSIYGLWRNQRELQSGAALPASAS